MIPQHIHKTQESIMFSTLKKGILTGVGLGLMTKDKVEAFAQKIGDEAKLSEEEGRKLVEEVLEQSKVAQYCIGELVNEKVKAAVDKLDLVTHADLQKVEAQLQQILDSLKKGSE